MRHVLAASVLSAWLTGCAEPQPATSPPATFGFPSSFTASDLGLVLAPAFRGIELEDPTAMVEAGGRFFVAEQSGRVYRFERDTRERTLVLDLSSRTQSGEDVGLLALAMHPQFGIAGSENRGHFYVYYAHRESPIPAADLKIATDTLTRLSRFTISDGEDVADPDSELVLIELHDRHVWHQGGGMFFHPGDGFLYLAIGDEGGVGCRYDNCQRLARSHYGGVLRIDVDRRGGDVRHPIRRAPEDGRTDHYFVPSDNPFVDDPDVLEEFYAIGLRNPHRMTHDPGTGAVFIGDVGHQLEEEVDVLSPGANFQWNLFEGSAPTEDATDPTRPRPGVWTDPAIAYPRADLEVLIGGYVYRGAALPALHGKYVHADFNTGNLWAASFDVDDGRFAISDSEIVLESSYAGRRDGITSFARDTDERLYALVLGSGSQILELVAADPVDRRIPGRLSETGLFADLGALTPARGVVEYEVNTPLWSDGASKRRFIALPDATSLRFEGERDYRFPPGTLFVKHFEIALDARKPERRRRLETRVLVVTEDGIYGVTFKWNDDQSDAVLLRERVEEELDLVDDGGARSRITYSYPSPGDCLRCHDPQGAKVLGFKTGQLNVMREGHAQLAELAERGVFNRPPSDDELAVLPRFAAIDDQAAPLETRVRSYLDANCASCHGARALGDARWDARFETPLPDQGIVDGLLHSRSADPDMLVVAPGDLARSDLYQRVLSEDPARRMPPLASRLPDAAFVTLLEEWIAGLE